MNIIDKYDPNVYNKPLQYWVNCDPKILDEAIDFLNEVLDYILLHPEEDLQDILKECDGHLVIMGLAADIRYHCK